MPFLSPHVLREGTAVLESIVSSRIRRTLIEHLLAHPAERVYLRGLAKQLNLSISPLRRELKRLEAAGVLKATDEGSMRFYLVDQTAPLFLQLHQPVHPSVPSLSDQPMPEAASTPLRLTAPGLDRTRRAMQRVTPWPWLIGTFGLGLGLVVAVGAAAYVMSTNRQMVSLLKPVATKPSATTAAVAVVQTESRASGVMHSSRWRMSPGTMGGFSSGSQSERY